MNPKAQISGNISLLFGIMIFLLLLLFAVILNIERGNVEEQTQYSQLNRASSAQGAVLYQAGWLANLYANQVIEVDSQSVPLGQAVADGLEQETIERVVNRLRFQTVLQQSSDASMTLSVFVGQGDELVYCEPSSPSNQLGSLFACTEIEEMYSVQALDDIEELFEGYESRLNTPKPGAEVGWAAVPGEEMAVIGVVVW